MHACVQEDLQWERAMVVVDDNKNSIEMPLTGMQIALATMQQADGSHGRNNDNNTVGLVITGGAGQDFVAGYSAYIKKIR